MRGILQWNLFIKNCVLILTCLNIHHFQSTLHLMQYTYWDIFSTTRNNFWTCWFWCLLVLLPFFLSPPPHQQNISLWRYFSSGKTNTKVAQGKIKWKERVGHEEVMLFLVKNCWKTGVLVNHPSWNGQMYWKSLQKKFTKAKHSLSQWCQLVHWCRWVPGTLT